MASYIRCLECSQAWMVMNKFSGADPSKYPCPKCGENAIGFITREEFMAETDIDGEDLLARIERRWAEMGGRDERAIRLAALRADGEALFSITCLDQDCNKKATHEHGIPARFEAYTFLKGEYYCPFCKAKNLILESDKEDHIQV